MRLLLALPCMGHGLARQRGIASQAYSLVTVVCQLLNCIAATYEGAKMNARILSPSAQCLYVSLL